jgi:hypothetical protein
LFFFFKGVLYSETTQQIRNTGKHWEFHSNFWDCEDVQLTARAVTQKQTSTGKKQQVTACRGWPRQKFDCFMCLDNII